MPSPRVSGCIGAEALDQLTLKRLANIKSVANSTGLRNSDELARAITSASAIIRSIRASVSIGSVCLTHVAVGLGFPDSCNEGPGDPVAIILQPTTLGHGSGRRCLRQSGNGTVANPEPAGDIG
jgi:hypothetical protein